MMSVSVCPSVCDGSALWSRCMPGRGEGSSRAMLATARPSCLDTRADRQTDILITIFCIPPVAVRRNGRAFARDAKGRGFESRPVRFQVTALHGQAAHTHLSPSSIIWYRPVGGNTLRLRRQA